MGRSSTPPTRRPMRPPDAAQQQSIWQRRLSAGALCFAGRVWQSCRGEPADQPLRRLGSAWRAPLARRARAGHAGVSGRRDHLGRVSGARAAARGAGAGGVGSRRVGAPAWPTAPGRWLGVGLGAPTRPGQAHYPVQRGLWVRILSYRVTDARLGEVGQVDRLVTTLLNPRVAPALELIGLYHERWEVELVIDEIKTHERVQRKVLRSKTPEGVRQELYGIFLAHYAVRALMAQAAVEAELDPDRLSFTEGIFVLTETLDLALLLEPEEATEPRLRRVRQQMVRQLLPVRRLRVNRREVKQVYNKYKPKKRQVPPPEPSEPEDQFLDFVQLLDPLAPQSSERVLK